MESKRGLLRFADGVDKLLLLFGTLGCIGDGSMCPLTMFVLSGLMNEYGGSGFALSMDVVDKVCMPGQIGEIFLNMYDLLVAYNSHASSRSPMPHYIAVLTQAALCCHWSRDIGFHW